MAECASPKLRCGQIVSVEFLDHVENSSRPMPFTCYGKLLAANGTHKIVGSCIYKDRKKPRDNNETRWTIMESAVQITTVLRPNKTQGKLRRGKLVAVEFADCIRDVPESTVFIVYGKLISLKRSAIVVGSWLYKDIKRKHDHNESLHTIDRASIRKVTILIPAK